VEGVVLPSGRVDEQAAIRAIQAIKRRRATSGGLLEPIAPAKYHDLAGWDEATRTMKRYANKGGFSNRNSPARLFMVAILGVTGMGKTHWVKMLPRIVGHNLQALEVNASSIMGTGSDAGLVGSVERSWQRLITQSRMADGCVILFDEAEKMWGGVQSSAKTEGGAFLRGHSLWLKEIELARIDPANSPMVFWFATLNSTDNLRPEDLSRADQIWYVGLPSHRTRRGIIEIHARTLESRYPGIFADDVTYDWMAERCEGRTGRAMKQIIARAYVEADDLITRQAFEQAVHGVTSIDTLFKQAIERQAQVWGRVLPHVDRGLFKPGDQIAQPLQIEDTSRGLVARRGHGVAQSFESEQEVDAWLTGQSIETQKQRQQR
jgi:SpoVK/Ycf46/Vps4 family AAA+-type ATPase